MRILIGTGALTLALLLGGCGGDGDKAAKSGPAAPLTQIAAPNGDWTQTVSETPEGGFRMGNPAAPVKLVEYASFTCPHCAEFSEQGGEALRNDYVKSGQVSWEFRPYVLFPTDPGISMLLRCHGPAAFFQLAEQIYTSQPEWVGKLQAMTPEAQQALEAMAPQERPAALVRAAGMDQFFRVRGMQESKISACLADPQGLTDLMAISTRATNQEGVTGTPTFFINGNKVEDAASWAALQPALRKAVR